MDGLGNAVDNMPDRLPTICIEPACESRTDGGLRCKQHRNKHAPRRLYVRGTLYNKQQWRRRLRKMVLAQQPICQWPDCTEDAVDVDHIRPLAQGGTNHLSNLQGLCKRHHAMKTKKESGRCATSQSSYVNTTEATDIVWHRVGRSQSLQAGAWRSLR